MDTSIKTRSKSDILGFSKEKCPTHFHSVNGVHYLGQSTFQLLNYCDVVRSTIKWLWKEYGQSLVKIGKSQRWEV